MGERKFNILIVGATGRIGKLIPDNFTRQVGMENIGSFTLYGREESKINAIIEQIQTQQLLAYTTAAESMSEIELPEYFPYRNFEQPDSLPIDLVFLVPSVRLTEDQRNNANFRENYLKGNSEITERTVIPLLKNLINRQGFCPYILCLTNPVNAVTTYIYERLASELGDVVDPKKIVASGGILDSHRAKIAIARWQRCLPKSVNAVTMGEHGETLFISPNLSTVGGASLTDLMCMFGEMRAQFTSVEAEVREKGLTLGKLIGTPTDIDPAMEMAILARHLLVRQKQRDILLPAHGYDPEKGLFIGGSYRFSSKGCVPQEIDGIGWIEDSQNEKAARKIHRAVDRMYEYSGLKRPKMIEF